MRQYVGKINHIDGYAQNELFTVLFPNSIRLGHKASVVMQWTKKADGEVKANGTELGSVATITCHEDGSKEVEICKDSENYYWFKLALNGGEDEMGIKFYNNRDEYCGEGTAKLLFQECTC
ncbi:hypothetical protein TWF718_007851 [Orbilia javanica]|uniref:Uncharacterized protein n=1 Tax=Orbilia javanica TaxID=47235 RepID=A0AAN8RCN7_9PEZI